jgi:predicted metal-dependent hydrolase
MIFNLRRSAPPISPTRDLEIDGLSVSVVLRRNAQARRFILKIGTRNREVVLTMPSNGSEAEAMDFAISQAHWIKSRITAQSDIIDFVDGAEIPLRDVMHTIDHRPGERGTVWTLPGKDEDEGLTDEEEEAFPVICVAGDAHHLARRLRDWLKKQARADLRQSVEIHSRHLGLHPKNITIRDQTTRWGSCSSTGALSFSWRLILAPSYVLDYVAAHEVAHLEEMNHSPRFWKLVEQRLPDYRQAQKWLKNSGARLHIYGK